MHLTPLQTVAIMLAVAAGCQLTRWLPFWLFPEGKKPPELIHYLEKVLPAATMGLLVDYCLQGASWGAAPYGVPELLGVAAVVILHRWRNSVLVSIAGGTAVYMLLIRLVF